MEQQRTIKAITGRDVYVPEFEEIKKSDLVNSAGRASYVERNQWMIDDSDYCVFYYVSAYLPQKRKHSLKSVSKYQPKSGTALALEYAKDRNKRILYC